MSYNFTQPICLRRHYASPPLEDAVVSSFFCRGTLGCNYYSFNADVPALNKIELGILRRMELVFRQSKGVTRPFDLAVKGSQGDPEGLQSPCTPHIPQALYQRLRSISTPSALLLHQRQTSPLGGSLPAPTSRL